jgi:hypothetical protein
VRYASTPFDDAPKAQSGALCITCDARATASPVNVNLFVSNDCAKSVPWRTNNSHAGGTKRAWDAGEASKSFGSEAVSNETTQTVFDGVAEYNT